MRAATLCLFAALFVISWATAQELLTNPGFESGPADGLPDGWVRYGGTVPESRVEVSPEARSGQRCVRIIDTGPNERDGKWAAGVSQTLPVEQGRAYRASVWARCLARNHPDAMALQLTFMPSRTVFYARLSPEIGGDWVRFTTVGEPAAGDTHVTLYLYSMHFWTCDYLVDDVSLTVLDAEQVGQRYPLAKHGGFGIETVRALNLRTPIVSGGKAAATVCIPPGEDWATVGARLVDGIERKTGARLPLTTDARSLLDSEQTIIAIGDMNTNFVTERLHWNRYLVADGRSLAAGKWVLRTVHEPFNFRDGVNIVTVEARDTEGAGLGVDALVALIPDGPESALDAPLLVNPSYRPSSEEARQKLLETPLTQDGWMQFCTMVEMYRDRGDPVYAEKAIQLLMLLWDRYQRQPDYAVTWPEETGSQRIGVAWDVLEECPLMTEDQRLKGSLAVLTVCYELTRHVSGWGRHSTNDTITWNHTTFPILGIYFAARHFQRWYGNVDGKIDFMMAEVHGCFRGQMNCWKPQCDADSYLTIVPRHLMDYTLAENDYKWFADGHCREFAEYLTAVSDNRGIQAGFGDSSYTDTPGFEMAGLPMALWYYKDGRYLWRLQQITNGAWVSPYDPSVRPRTWHSMAGLTVTPLPDDVYEFTRTRSYYGEEVTPPNVPAEQAFDKITFRENLDPSGEFLLLDGYSRGKHLHYDGNSIIKFSADGEDWLIDGDYLVRNTTEHNMVSVVRDGRCAELIPPCAGKDRAVSLGKAAFTSTFVRGYNGCDWTRDIAWAKGEFFLVVDDCKALVDGDFGFETVWKTLDRGEQTLEEGRVFATVIPNMGGVGTRGLVRAPGQSRQPGTAVRFADKQSRLDFAVDLPAGRYSVELVARGLDTGTDSLWVKADTGEQIAFHTPIDEFGPCSSGPSKEGDLPSLDLTGDGPHLISITLRENAGVLMDRMVFRDRDGSAVASAEAEAPPSIPEGLHEALPDSRFFIKGDGEAKAAVTTRVSNVGLMIRKFHQKFGGRLVAGEGRSSISLFYNDTTKAPKQYDLRRVGERTALITRDGKPVGVFSAAPDELALPWLVTDAACIMVLGSELYVVDATHLAMMDVRTDRPVSFRLNLDQGFGLVHADRDTTVRLPMGDEYQLPRGDVDFDVTQLGDTSALRALKEIPAAVAARLAPQPAPASAEPRVPALAQTWKMGPVEQDGAPAPVMKLRAVDLDADGTDELLALIGRSVHCLDQSGATRWSFETAGTLRAVSVGNIIGDARPEVLIGGDDETLYVLDTQGVELARKAITAPLRVGTSSVRQPQVASLCAGDVDADGRMDVFVGTRNGNILRLTHDLQEVWAFNQVEHGTREMVLLDIDPAPGVEVLAGNKYGAVEILTAAGKPLAGVHSELGDVEMAVGDLDGDGRLEIANGSSTGAFTCRTHGGPTLFEFPNYGYGAMDVLISPLGEDPSPRVVIASETGYIYALDRAGSVVHQVNLGAPVLCVSRTDAVPGARLVAGCRDGSVCALDSNLHVVGCSQFGSPVEYIAPLAGPASRPLVAIGGGAIVAAIAGAD